VFDGNSLTLVVRSDFAFEVSHEVGFLADTTAARVKGRFSVAWPMGVNKTMRSYKIVAEAPAKAGR